MKKVGVLISFLFIISALRAQVTFQTTIGGSGDDEAFCVRQTTDGGYIICGSTTSFNTYGDGATDAYVVKTDANGTVVWEYNYGGIGAQFLNSIQQTTDGGYIATGTFANAIPAFSSNPPNNDVYILKLNSNGTEAWTNFIGSASADIGSNIKQLQNGDLIVVGTVIANGTSNRGYVARMNINGNIVWQQVFADLSTNMGLVDIQELANGDLICVGYENSSSGVGGFGIQDGLIVKINGTTGTILNTAETGSAYNDGFSSVAISSNGNNIYAVGNSHDLSGGSGFGAFFVNINSGLTANTWTALAQTGTKLQRSYSLNITNSGNLISSITDGAPSASSDAELLLLDNNGNKIWSKGYGGAKEDVFEYTSQTADGGYIATGYTSSFSTGGDQDIFLVKTDANGDVPSVGCGTVNVSHTITTKNYSVDNFPIALSSNTVTVVQTNIPGNAQTTTLTPTCVCSTQTVSVIASSATICIGNTITLTASGANLYTWLPSAGLSSTTSATVIATPTVTTSYTVTGTNSCGTNTAVSTITVLNPPTINVNSATICTGISVSLTANGANTYTWSPTIGLSGSTGTTVSANPLNTVTYSIVGTDINNCSNSTTATVTVNPLPSVTVNSASICAGSSTLLTATGANTYTWTPATDLSANTGANVTATPTVTTTYSISGTDINGCKNSTSSMISISHPSIITVNLATICAGDSAVLNANGANTYSWFPTTNLSGATGTSVIASPLTTTSYSVIGTNGCGSDTAVSTVIIHPLPAASLISNNTGCQAVNASIKGSNGKAPYLFTYQINGVTQVPVSSDPSGVANLSQNNVSLGSYTYSVIGVSDANHCSSPVINQTSIINVYSKPNALFTVSPEKTTILKSSITLNNASIGGDSWKWDFGDSITSFSQNPGAHTYADTGHYTIRLITITQYGCEDSTYQSVIITLPFVLYVPNTFTPNGNGINDVFAPKGEGILNYEMYIYDRWGQNIFYTNDLTVGWDGKANGGSKPAQMDSYVYVIDVKAATDMHDYTYKGTINLVR